MSHKSREITYPEGFKGVFDTHAHLYDPKLIGDAEDVLSRAVKCGVERILIPSDNVDTSRQAVEYAGKWDGYKGIELYCSIGVHPHEASGFYEADAERFITEMMGLKDELKIRAIGEIGLDYHYDFSPRDVQKDVFIRQLKLAYELDVPIVLHEREATGDCLEIIKDCRDKGFLRNNPGVCHCCSCSAEAAGELIKMGFYLGFDGPLTFKNNKKTPRTLDVCPLDRIVIETDSPYLAPEPLRGKVNEPSFVLFVAEKIGELKGITTEEVIKITYDNANELFNLM